MSKPRTPTLVGGMVLREGTLGEASGPVSDIGVTVSAVSGRPEQEARPAPTPPKPKPTGAGRPTTVVPRPDVLCVLDDLEVLVCTWKRGLEDSP